MTADSQETPTDEAEGFRRRLGRIFRDILTLPPHTDVEALVYRSAPNWDSLTHMRLVAAIEDEFGVRLDTDQVLDLDSFEAAVKVLRDLDAGD